MSSGAIGALTGPNRTKTATFSALRCLKRPCPESAQLLLTLSSCALLLATAAAGQALASHGQIDLLRGLPRPARSPVRARTRSPQLQSLGVKALRVELNWADVAPAANSATKPSFDATNPGLYAWGEYDALIAEANRLHWPVLLTITSPVPRWATSNKKAPYITRPDDKDFQEFMTAVGAPLRLGGLAVLDLERAQPPGLPAAAVELQRHARLAAHLPRALPGRLRRAAGRWPGASAGALRRDRADRLRQRQGPAAQGKIAGAAARRGAARVLPRSAVPERPLPARPARAASCR